MIRMCRLIAIALLLMGCSPAFVQNTPRATLLGQRYDDGEVRDAVARALTRRHVPATGEAAGQALARDSHHGTTCDYTIQYTEANVRISIAQPAPPPPQSWMIDQSCLDQADALLKSISAEVKRPAKVAAKAERARQKHELSLAREQRAAQEAALAREQLEQQQQQQAQPAQESGGGGGSSSDDGQAQP